MYYKINSSVSHNNKESIPIDTYNSIIIFVCVGCLMLCIPGIYIGRKRTYGNLYLIETRINEDNHVQNQNIESPIELQEIHIIIEHPNNDICLGLDTCKN